MSFFGYKAFFRFCVCAPQNKNYRGRAFVEFADYVIRKYFPPLPFVAVRASRADGQNRIQKQYAVIRPLLQATVVRRVKSEIVFQLFENIDK